LILVTGAPSGSLVDRNKFAKSISADPEVSARFSSAEDIILSKLDWYRLGGEVSERQWRDGLGVLKTRAGALDLSFMRKRAKELKVGDLMDKVLVESAYLFLITRWISKLSLFFAGERITFPSVHFCFRKPKEVLPCLKKERIQDCVALTW